MASKSTYVYKTAATLEILLDVYTRKADLSSHHLGTNTPVVLFFHGGGVVSHDRRLLYPHIVQSCLKRGWPLVSADYRLFPQADGLDVLEDLKDAYAFVREKLPGVLNIGAGPMTNVIVSGQSAGMLSREAFAKEPLLSKQGAFLAYQAGHLVRPRPLALLTYYGHGTSDDDWFRSNKVLFEPPVTLDQIGHFLDEPVHCGFTPPSSQFDPNCLLEDLKPNPAWKKPAEEVGGLLPRDFLFFYLNQNNRYPQLGKGIDKSYNDPAWKNFPPTIIIHGDQDPFVLLEASETLVTVIGTSYVIRNLRDEFATRMFILLMII